MSIRGFESLEQLSRQIDQLVTVTDGDLLSAMVGQGRRILMRTAKFLDVNEDPFQPYNEDRPYYYYPDGTGLSKRAHEAKIAAFHKQHGGERTSRGIRYKSYGDFKRALGRLGVDLLGPHDPHMLDLFEIFVNGQGFRFGSADVDYDQLVKPAGIITMGIYEFKGEIAASHNEGLGRMPKREFFAISASDQDFILNDVSKRITRRLQEQL